MDLENYVLLLDCRRNDNKPSITHFIQIKEKKQVGIFCLFNIGL